MDPLQDVNLARALVESAPDALVLVDETGRIAHVNLQVELLFGFKRAELLGQKVEVLMPERFRCRHIGHRDKYQEAPHARPMGVSLQLFGLRKNGSEFPLEICLSPIDSNGIRFTSAAIRDATGRHEAALRELLLRNQAETALLAKERFMAVLSHELRTPLTPALLLVENLQRDNSLPQYVLTDLETIVSSIHLEVKLIDDLLDLTKIANGKLRLERRPIHLHPLITASVAAILQQFDAKSLSLNVLLLAKHDTVDADAARLQQVLWNLLRNALKFSPPGGVITVRSMEDLTTSDYLQIDVIDTGIGIDPIVLSRLFSAFEQGSVEITRQFGGLGLGLCLSRRLAEAHDGSLIATSAGKGKGATFSLRLPVATLAPSPLRYPTPAVDMAPQGPALSILLVEDNLSSALILQRLLSQRFGHSCRLALTFYDADRIITIEKMVFDLLISDIGLPDGDGCDLMRAHKRQNGDDACGIALSGFGMPEDVSRSLAAGFSRHLTKPVSSATLKSAIDQAAAQLGAIPRA
jgi:PAS domain S-box-containing protein